MASKQEWEKPFVSAVIPAAGSASRMNGLDKQFEEVCGVPVLVRSMQALSQSDWIDELVVVARSDDIPDVLALVNGYGIGKVRSVVAGGQTRQQSVMQGLEAVSGEADYLAVHDGARPLVSQQVIADAVLSAIRYGAAAAGGYDQSGRRRPDDLRDPRPSNPLCGADPTGIPARPVPGSGAVRPGGRPGFYR